MINKKICFIFDESIFNHHHGVRRYIFSMMNALLSSFQIDTLCYKDKCLYKVNISLNDLPMNGFCENNVFGQTRQTILKKLKGGDKPKLPKIKKWPLGEKYTESSSSKEYDITILVAPWVYKDERILPSSKKAFVIGHDGIPNFYMLVDPSNREVSLFAQKHIRGYTKYIEIYDGILATNETSAEQCRSIIMKSSSKSIGVLPIILPAGFQAQTKKKNNYRKKHQIILAAPFDLRKGLQSMPSIINQIKAESLVIFGGIRCDINDVIHFFDKLELESITWWDSVTTDKQIHLYSESSLLLFPSLNEGLGLPVLEASACGARVAVSNIKPLNRLVLKSSILSHQKNANNRLLNLRLGDAESKFIKKQAYEKWNHNHLKRFFELL